MRKKKQGHAEYRLLIFPSFSEVTKKFSTLFRLETVKEFANFSYEIAVEERVLNNTISWKIHGLRSPQVSLPATGPAAFAKKYENLRGVYEFTITKLDGAENSFTLSILEQKVSVVKVPKHRFIKVLTSQHEMLPAFENP